MKIFKLFKNETERMDEIYRELSETMSCGNCGGTTKVTGRYSCKSCGRMLCNYCGQEIGYCRDHEEIK